MDIIDLSTSSCSLSDHYIVEEILNHKPASAQQHKDVTKYKIKWQGYKNVDATWEPAEMKYSEVPDIIDEYWLKIDKSKATPRHKQLALDKKDKKKRQEDKDKEKESSKNDKDPTQQSEKPKPGQLTKIKNTLSKNKKLILRENLTLF